MPLAHLSAHIGFADIPIQVRKCHLSNVDLISDQHTEQARELCNRLICNQLCCIYIHDNCDVKQNYASVACSLQSLNVPLDLASLLISKELVQLKTHSIRNSQADFKRTRNASDDPIIKSSSELRSMKDFEVFYAKHRARTPRHELNNGDHVNHDDDRCFELFDPPVKSLRLMEKGSEKQTIAAAAHPIVDLITEHFKFMTMKKTSFFSRCVCIMDPVTVLIESPGAKPFAIKEFEMHPERFPSEGKRPYKHLFCASMSNFFSSS